MKKKKRFISESSGHIMFPDLIRLTCFMQILWELCGFPAASLTGDNQKRAVFDGLDQLCFVPIDGQLFGLVFFGVPSC